MGANTFPGFGSHAAAGRAEQLKLAASMQRAPVETPLAMEKVKGQCIHCKKMIGKGVHFHERACKG